MADKTRKLKKPPTPPQPKPWDVPPYPPTGDPDQRALYASVGMALSQWEALEENLSRIFEMLVSPQGQSLAALRAYGSILAFRSRGDMIRAAAEGAFFLKPNPELHKELKSLIDEATNFAARRNEIAHGIIGVRYTPDLETIGQLLARMKTDGYQVGPPIYATNKTNLEPGRGLLEQAHHRPSYSYRSVEIDGFRAHFLRLAERAHEIVIKLMRHLGDLA